MSHMPLTIPYNYFKLIDYEDIDSFHTNIIYLVTRKFSVLI